MIFVPTRSVKAILGGVNEFVSALPTFGAQSG